MGIAAASVWHERYSELPLFAVRVTRLRYGRSAGRSLMATPLRQLQLQRPHRFLNTRRRKNSAVFDAAALNNLHGHYDNRRSFARPTGRIENLGTTK